MIKNNLIETILLELLSADMKHKPMMGRIEGLKTLQCEVAELDREVFREHHDPNAMVKEAIQVAAMAIKFLRDCCDMHAEDPVPACTGCHEDVPATDHPPAELKRTIMISLEALGIHGDLSKRGEDWIDFALYVLTHIENYTVPQYGDKGTDKASKYDLKTIAEQIEKYQARIGSGARGEIEAMRDLFKIAHYACMAHEILEDESELRRKDHGGKVTDLHPGGPEGTDLRDPGC